MFYPHGAERFPKALADVNRGTGDRKVTRRRERSQTRPRRRGPDRRWDDGGKWSAPLGAVAVDATQKDPEVTAAAPAEVPPQARDENREKGDPRGTLVGPIGVHRLAERTLSGRKHHQLHLNRLRHDGDPPAVAMPAAAPLTWTFRRCEPRKIARRRRRSTRNRKSAPGAMEAPPGRQTQVRLARNFGITAKKWRPQFLQNRLRRRGMSTESNPILSGRK